MGPLVSAFATSLLRRNCARLVRFGSLGLLAALLAAPCAAGQKYHVNVFPDRRQPTWVVPVDDFRVNETIINEGGVQYVTVRGPEGVFQVPFKDIAEIQFLRLTGYMQSSADVAIFESRIVGHSPEMVRYGTIWLRVMLGVSRGQPWYLMPKTTVDKGAYLAKIVFGEGMGEEIPTERPKEKALGEPIATPGAIVQPPTPVAPLAPAPAPADEAFAKMTLDELNARSPLADPFFDFDKSDLRPDAKNTLIADAEWLKAHPTTKIELFGYCDPRGTNEYNLGLGERRAEAARQFLVSQGVSAGQLSVVSKGKTQMFCLEPTEACYAQNRRVHFVFTAK